jgi:TolB-like protein
LPIGGKDVTDAPTERAGEGALGKLRQRKVVQWGLAYAAAAWTILQVIEFLGETYAWPPAIRQIATPALGFGLFFVLVLAWYHGDKGEQKFSRPELAILGTLLAVTAGALWWYLSQLDERAWEADTGLPDIKHVAPTDAPSVAVLPFVNMSSDPEQEYFSDGLSEEILNALARIPGLYVPARTSSFQFKGKSGDVAKFAAMLGVATVLEGSVRKAGSRVRITAQLVNAADGYHLWSQTYDRDLKDIFAVQEEISKSIAEALRIRLTAQQSLKATAAQPTTNMDAYEAYLLGRYELKKRRPAAVAAAIAHFEKAVALDPQFADAYGEMAYALMITGKEYLPTAEEKALSRRYLDKALALGPDRPAVLAAAGYRIVFDTPMSVHRYDENGQLNPEVRVQLEKALDFFDRALAANPSDVNVWNWRQNVLEGLGRPVDHMESTAEALKRDPLSVRALKSRIYALEARGFRSESVPLLERLSSIDPASAASVRVDFAWKDGDNAEAARQLLLKFDNEGAFDVDTAQMFGGLLIFFGLRDEAFKVGAEAHDAGGFAFLHWGLAEFQTAADMLSAQITEDQLGYACSSGHAYYLAGDFVRSERDLDKCWRWGVPMLGVGGARLVLAADAARRQGHDDKARKYIGWLKTELDKAERNDVIPDRFLLVMYHAYLGDMSRAAEYLVPAVMKEDFWFEAPHLAVLGDLTKRPDYRRAVEQRKVELARQREQFLHMLCGPNPVSTKYQPLPETCRGVQRAN